MTADAPPFLEARDGGVLVTLHVQPRAGRTALVGPHDAAIRVRVQEPAVDGKATEAARKLLAEVLHVSPGRVALHSGARSRLKRFFVDQITPADAAARLVAPPSR